MDDKKQESEDEEEYYYGESEEQDFSQGSQGYIPFWSFFEDCFTLGGNIISYYCFNEHEWVFLIKHNFVTTQPNFSPT